MLNRMFNTSDEDKTELTIRTINGSINLSIDGSTDAVLPTFNEFDMMMTIVAYAKELDIQKGMYSIAPDDTSYGFSILHFLSYPLVLSFKSEKELLKNLKGYTNSNENIKLLNKTLSCFKQYTISFDKSLLLTHSAEYSYGTSRICTKRYPKDGVNDFYQADATFKIVEEIKVYNKNYHIRIDPVFWSLLMECVDSEFDSIDTIKGFSIDKPVLMTCSNEVHVDPFADL